MPSICEVAECGKPAEAKGLCGMHRKRYARHGHLSQTRPASWGSGHKHPLYQRWKSMRRTSAQAGGHVARWDTFALFLEDVGEAPSPTCRLYRLDARKPFGPGNITWRDRVQDAKAGRTREERNAYSRAWSAQRPMQRKALYLKRHYGVTIEWYDARLEEQGDLCAICRGPERKINPRTGSPFLLAVDHDHVTGTPRGLLCASCNHGLGNFGDDAERLRRAAAYLDTAD